MAQRPCVGCSLLICDWSLSAVENISHHMIRLIIAHNERMPASYFGIHGLVLQHIWALGPGIHHFWAVACPSGLYNFKFAIKNFRIPLLLLLGIYYIWADAWARPVVTKFTIAMAFLQKWISEAKSLGLQHFEEDKQTKVLTLRTHQVATWISSIFLGCCEVVNLIFFWNFGNELFKCLRISFLKFLIIFFNFENYFLNFIQQLAGLL